ncbi:hypothetical protein BDQ12DRAFT_680755 [Crucibulum laeve]|uniref:Uncharacterized protein n=1 Tax=Crucibulum laeve TaxID=68775 RepID=A0A5C3M602_9AGAR|nr:hypothetical protein BDQ12DRAFT_680755 [Crucibulum laeve]
MSLVAHISPLSWLFFNSTGMHFGHGVLIRRIFDLCSGDLVPGQWLHRRFVSSLFPFSQFSSHSDMVSSSIYTVT